MAYLLLMLALAVGPPTIIGFIVFYIMQDVTDTKGKRIGCLLIPWIIWAVFIERADTRPATWHYLVAVVLMIVGAMLGYLLLPKQKVKREDIP